jgi:hypothetical protein
MKTKVIFKAAFLFSFIISTVVACKKDRTILIIDKTNNTLSFNLDAANFWNSAAPQKQTFTFNATSGGWISGAKGCSIYLPGNAIIDAANTTVSGNVTMELTEYMSKADMVFSGVTAISANELLESGGMFNLVCKRGSEELKLKSATTAMLIVKQANKTFDAMDFFVGNDNTAKDKLNKVNWALKDSVKARPKQDSGGTGGSKAFFNCYINYFQFGYCNFDRYWTNGKIKVKKFRIKLPKGCNDTNSTALIMFKNYNSCACCFWINKDSMSSGYNLPQGEIAKILIYKKTGTAEDDIEYSTQEITFTEETTVVFNAALTKCTKTQLMDIVKAL